MAGWGSVFSLVHWHWGQMSAEHGVCLESVDRPEWWAELTTLCFLSLLVCQVPVPCRFPEDFSLLYPIGWDVLPVSCQVEDGVQEGSLGAVLRVPSSQFPLGVRSVAKP